MKQADAYLKSKGLKNEGKRKKMYFLAGLGLLATTALTFFGIYYWKKHKSTAPSDQPAPDFKAENPAPKPKPTPKGQTKKATPPPAEKDAAKKAAPKDAQPPVFEPAQLANTIRNAVIGKQFLAAYTALKKIRNLTDYKAVNTKFTGLVSSFTRFTRQTLVNALLDAFKLEAQRKVLFYEFKRIGLKYDGSKWTLGTVDISPELITTQATKVWKDPRTSVNVPMHMILGREVCKRGNFTLFEHAKSYFLVESKAVKSIQS
jgi:hypothetical protein